MNIAEKLAREIMRVTALRCQYEEAERITNDGSRRQFMVNFKPAIFLMNTALEAACEAVGTGEVMNYAKALADLEGFRS